uniref:Uncharacterized protein n=1 Tax=uncultured Armatimonadetes bacterium TaxID=157466 RepID=A0A6J4K2Q0_9BACT|nr:hypothetical protein AVDCRST_MAG63-4630 [uncultured Armatimonadetes bacterium]
MRLLRPTTEDDMIAVFLRAEAASERFGQKVAELLERDGKGRDVVDTPDIGSAEENAYRRRLLGGYRAYVFEELPADVSWHRALLDRQEVARVRYIDYSYWNEISGGSRLPSHAAETIRAGREIYGQSNERFLRMARGLRDGATFPELIVVGASPDAGLTVLEGHVRLTAYLLAPDHLPDHLEVIAGFAPGL